MKNVFHISAQLYTFVKLLINMIFVTNIYINIYAHVSTGGFALALRYASLRVVSR